MYEPICNDPTCHYCNTGGRNQLFEDLMSDDFMINFMVGTHQALYRLLKKDEVVQRAKEFYGRSPMANLTSQNIEEKCNELFQDHFKKGYRFPYDLTIAAFAVAIMPDSIDDMTPFEDEFIFGMASLDIIEMVSSRGVAMEIINELVQ